MEAPQGDKRRTERVLFETDRHVIVGDVSLPSQGYQSRFSDAINRADVGFISVVNVEMTPIEDGETQKRDFIVLSKAHIRLAFPVDED